MVKQGAIDLRNIHCVSWKDSLTLVCEGVKRVCCVVEVIVGGYQAFINCVRKRVGGIPQKTPKHECAGVIDGYYMDACVWLISRTVWRFVSFVVLDGFGEDS